VNQSIQVMEVACTLEPHITYALWLREFEKATNN